jgi:hypothetical protein
MAVRTACGRNMLRTPQSAGWVEFKAEPEQYKCDLCAASKQAEFNLRCDAKAVEVVK